MIAAHEAALRRLSQINPREIEAMCRARIGPDWKSEFNHNDMFTLFPMLLEFYLKHSKEVAKA